MVEITQQTIDKKNSYGKLTIEYNPNTHSDLEIINDIIENALNKQSRCDNCLYYKSDGCFGGYESHSCRLYGDVDALANPYHKFDGSKCKDFLRKY